MSKENKSLLVDIVLFLLFIDLVGFVCWGLSGQQPEGKFYAGVMSRSIVQTIIK